MDTQAQGKWIGRWFWAYCYGALGLSIILPPRSPAAMALEIASVFLGGFLSYLWFLNDSRGRGIEPSRRFKMGVILVAAVFLPLHLLRTRGVLRGMGVLALFLVKLSLAVFIVSLLLYGLILLGLFNPHA